MKSIMSITGSLLCWFGFTMLCHCPMAAAAPVEVIYPESTFGDYADDETVASSYLGVFRAGTHVVTGNFGETGNPIDDGDIFSFTVPNGYVLNSVDLRIYTFTGDNGNGSFLAIQDDLTVGTTIQTSSNHLSNMLISQTGEILDDLAGGIYAGGASQVTNPLPANDYAVFLHEITANVDFALAFTVTPVPEPASVGLLAMGSLTWRLFRRRKSLVRIKGRNLIELNNRDTEKSV